MFTIIIRSIILYIIILGVFRLMGKRQIGQMQPFELVLTLIIADLATIPMSETTLPLLHGIIPLLSLLVVHFFITIICQKSNKLNTLINGKPIIVINPNGIDYQALKSLNISVDDLLEGMRGCGFYSFDEVQFAIVETTGKFNILPKAQYAQATLGDLNIVKEKTTLPITLVSEGAVLKDNLKLANVDDKFIKEILQKNSIKKIKEVVVLTIDNNGKIFLQPKNKTFLVIQTSHKGESKI